MCFESNLGTLKHQKLKPVRDEGSAGSSLGVTTETTPSPLWASLDLRTTKSKPSLDF